MVLYIYIWCIDDHGRTLSARVSLNFHFILHLIWHGFGFFYNRLASPRKLALSELHISRKRFDRQLMIDGNRIRSLSKGYFLNRLRFSRSSISNHRLRRLLFNFPEAHHFILLIGKALALLNELFLIFHIIRYKCMTSLLDAQEFLILMPNMLLKILLFLVTPLFLLWLNQIL